MARLKNFGLRLGDQEHYLLDVLSDRLERTRSDVIRRLILQAARQIGVEAAPQSVPAEPPAGQGRGGR